MNKKDLKKNFPFVSDYYLNAAISKEYPFSKYKTERGVLGMLQRLNDSAIKIIETPNIKCLEVRIIHCESRIWGYVPKAYYTVVFDDNTSSDGKSSSQTGCGYDKISSALAEVFNDVAKGMAYRKRKKKEKPYGIGKDLNNLPYFQGGIGESCYFKIARFLGLKKIVVHRGSVENFYTFSK